MNGKSAKVRLIRQWTYTNPRGLTKFYGHVDYYGQYVIGQWFVLDAVKGSELWTGSFWRANAIRGCEDGVIVASELCSTGPWMGELGIYGIDVKTGELRWVSHGSGIWGKFLYCLDCIPFLANELKDSPRAVRDGHVITSAGRILDIQTGLPTSQDRPAFLDLQAKSPAKIFYSDGSLQVQCGKLFVKALWESFSLFCCDDQGREIWRFAAADHAGYVDTNYYSYRFHDGRVFILMGDAPARVPDPKRADYVIPNPANYCLVVVDVATGKFEMHSLGKAKLRTEARIETIREDNMLVSFDGKDLVAYKILAGS